MNDYMVFFNNGESKMVQAESEDAARDASLEYCKYACTSISGVVDMAEVR